MRSRVIALVVPAVLSVPLTALAGCGAEEPDGPDSSSSGAPAGSGAPESEDPAPQATSEPAVSPATGEPVELQSLTLRLSDGEWITSRVGISVAAVQEVEDPIGLFEVRAGDVTTTTTDFEEARQVVAAATEQGAPDLEAADDRTVGGVDLWVFTGEDDDRTVYKVGSLHAGHLSTITFTWPTAWPEGPQHVEEMLASVVWS